MAFTKKTIRIKIGIGGGQLGNEAPSELITLDGYRVVLNMSAYFGNTQGTIQCKIYGLSMDLMSQLTTIGPIMNQIRGQNSIAIEVGDQDGTLTMIFLGTIQTAWADFQESPNVALNVVAFSALWASVLPVGPSSFRGAQTVATILTQIVSKINAAAPGQNLVLATPVVDVVLRDQYLPGSGLDQIKAVVKAARCSYKIEQNVLTVWQSGTYSGEPPVTLSPYTDPGIVGYPTFSSDGLIVKSAFVQLTQGQQVIVENSVIPQANNAWIANNIIHNLESERPGGAWFTQFVGTRFLQ